MWWGWGRHHVGPTLNPAGGPMVLVVAGLGLLMVPGMLAAIERAIATGWSRSRTQCTTPASGQQTGSNRPAKKPNEARTNRD
jgi:hypothetical protein